MNKELLFKTFRNVTGAVLYIFFVSQVMQNGSKLFGNEDNMFTPFAVLLLFSLSAAVVGGLILGQSVILFLNKKNPEGIKATIYSIIWLATYTFLGLFVLFLTK